MEIVNLKDYKISTNISLQKIAFNHFAVHLKHNITNQLHFNFLKGYQITSEPQKSRTVLPQKIFRAPSHGSRVQNLCLLLWPQYIKKKLNALRPRKFPFKWLSLKMFPYWKRQILIFPELSLVQKYFFSQSFWVSKVCLRRHWGWEAEEEQLFWVKQEAC